MGAIQNANLGDEARQMSAVLLRRVFSNDFMDFYPKLPPNSQQQLKEQVLLAVQQVQTEQLRHKVCEVVAEVARNLIDDDGNNQWPQFLQVNLIKLIYAETKKFWKLFLFKKLKMANLFTKDLKQSNKSLYSYMVKRQDTQCFF